MCNYVNWAFIESIDLKDDVPDIEKLYTSCQDAGRIQTNEFAKIEDGSTLNGVSSNDLRRDLAARIAQWMKKEQVTDHKNSKANLEGTAGSNDPLYYMYWTNEDLLSLIA